MYIYVFVRRLCDSVLYRGTTWRARLTFCRRNIRYFIEMTASRMPNCLSMSLLLGPGKISDIVRAKIAKSEVHKLMRIQLGIQRPTVVIFLKRINRIKLRYDII